MKRSHEKKGYIALKRIFTFISLVVVLIGGVPAQPSTAVVAAPAPQVTSGTTCYLPMVNNRSCPGVIESPFALQIANENRLFNPTAGRLGATEAEMQAAAEAQARIEAAYPFLVQALADSGAAWTRIFLNWRSIQPLSPEEAGGLVYRWNYYDTKLKVVANEGIKMILTVAMSPVWATDAPTPNDPAAVTEPVPCAPISQSRLDEYASFLTELVNRYKQPPYNVKHWEMVNEPDGTNPGAWGGGLGCWGNDPDKYVQMLSVAYSTIKAADPEATVMMGGIAHDWFIEYRGLFRRSFPDRVMELGGGPFLDTFTFHYFPAYADEWNRWNPNSKDRQNGWIPAPTCGDVGDGQGTPYEVEGKDVAAKTTHLRNRMKACYGFDKPVWITELAEHGYPGETLWLEQQARYVIEGHARALAAGVTNITWYALVTSDPYEQGLLYSDWSPKPAFFTYRTLTAELKNYRYTATLPLAKGELYQFSNTCGEQKLVAWSEDKVYDKDSNGRNIQPAKAVNPIDFPVQAHQLRLVDYQGNETSVSDGGAGDTDGAVNGVITLQITNPVFVQVTQTGS